MQRYKLVEQDGQTVAVVVQEYHMGGPPVGSAIPADEENRHWRQYLAWVADGNTPDPKDE